VKAASTVGLPQRAALIPLAHWLPVPPPLADVAMPMHSSFRFHCWSFCSSRAALTRIILDGRRCG
jgi:hypothetical protein